MRNYGLNLGEIGGPFGAEDDGKGQQYGPVGSDDVKGSPKNRLSPRGDSQETTREDLSGGQTQLQHRRHGRICSSDVIPLVILAFSCP